MIGMINVEIIWVYNSCLLDCLKWIFVVLFRRIVNIIMYSDDVDVGFVWCGYCNVI